MRITILARKLSCMEGCNTFFDEAQPSSHFSCMTMAFRFLMKLRQQSKKNALVKHMSPDSGSLAPPNGMVPQALGNTGHGTIHTYIHTHTHTYTHTYIHTYLPTYLHTYIPTYLRTYVPTYTRTYIHTCMHAWIHTYLPTYIHTYIHIYIDTNIPTYQHTTTTGHGGGPEEPYHHHRPQGGGPEEPYHHPRPQGGPWVGLGVLGHIYIYMCVYMYMWARYSPNDMVPPRPQNLAFTVIWVARPPNCTAFGRHSLPFVCYFQHLRAATSSLGPV